MKKVYVDPLATFIGIIALLLLACSFSVILFLILQPKGSITCESFGSYYDIPLDWKIKYPQLDRNHDGIPCDTLYNERNDHA